MKTKIGCLNFFAVVSFCVSAFMYYKGYDKMTNYYSSEYGFANVNAYVGGDAYNYIINGTYSTSYFVVASAFMITGFLLILGGMIITSINSINVNFQNVPDDKVMMDDELPPL